METPLCRLLTAGVRDVVPVLSARGLGYTFGERAGGWQLGEPREQGDTTTAAGGLGSEATALACGLHRLLHAAAGLVSQGVVAIHASARPLRTGGCMLQLRIGSTGLLRGAEALADTALALGLAPHRHEGSAAAAPRRWQGRCPATQGAVSLACAPGAAFELVAHCRLRGARLVGGSVAAPAAPPRLWLLHDDARLAASSVGQAVEHGWIVSALATPSEALRRLHGIPPDLVIAFASPSTDRAGLLRLRRQLPAGVHAVTAVEPGSLWLAEADALPGYELHCHPFDRTDWQAWTQALAPAAVAPAGVPPPPLLPAAPRPRVLVADAGDVSRWLLQAMLENLGYEVHTARDTAQAMDACLRLAPAVLLADTALPGAGPAGFVHRLRLLQRGGLAPPCRVVAFSADVTPAGLAQAMGTGIDGFLPKPPELPALRAEMARWVWGHGVPRIDPAPAGKRSPGAAFDRRDSAFVGRAPARLLVLPVPGVHVLDRLLQGIGHPPTRTIGGLRRHFVHGGGGKDGGGEGLQRVHVGG